jgi:serine/threonine-protein kinase
MLTGRPPFERGSSQQLMAAHATEEPDPVVKRRRNTPPALAALVMRCLEKRPADRPRDAEHILLALDNAADTTPQTPVPLARAEAAGASSTQRPDSRRRFALATVGATLAVVAALVLIPWPRSQTKANVAWFDLALPDSVAPRSVTGQSIALSPDGSMVVYIGSSTQSLFVRPLDELVPSRLVGSEGAFCPSFSPNGQWIVFTSGGRLMKVAVRGGRPIVIADSAGVCGVWTDRNEIVFDWRGQLFRVSAGGGPTSLLTRSDIGSGIGSMMPTQALPGGNSALIDVSESFYVDFQIGLVSLIDGRITRLTPKSGVPRCGARYANGYIVYCQGGGQIVARPFSLRTLTFTGPEVNVLAPASDFGISDDGSLAYTTGGGATYGFVAVGQGGRMRTLSGRSEASGPRLPAETALDTTYYSWPRLSPDGKRVAMEMQTGPFTWDVWVYDIGSRTLTRLTNRFRGIRPAGWTADSRNVVYIALDSGYGAYNATRRLVAQAWDGSAPPIELMPLAADVHDVSVGPPHGIAALTVLHAGQGSDIWTVSLDTPKVARPLVATEAGEGQSRLSHDGRLLAFSSNESGRWEVYIRSALGPARRLQVSTSGGGQAVWSADDRQLYYRAPEYMMRATIAGGSAPSVIRRDTLFKDVFVQHNIQNYDVFPGGNELLMIRNTSAASWRAGVLLNWPELVRQRAAVR